MEANVTKLMEKNLKIKTPMSNYNEEEEKAKVDEEQLQELLRASEEAIRKDVDAVKKDIVAKINESNEGFEKAIEELKGEFEDTSYKVESVEESQ